MPYGGCGNGSVVGVVSSLFLPKIKREETQYGMDGDEGSPLCDSLKKPFRAGISKRIDPIAVFTTEFLQHQAGHEGEIQIPHVQICLQGSQGRYLIYIVRADRTPSVIQRGHLGMQHIVLVFVYLNAAVQQPSLQISLGRFCQRNI